MIHQNVFGHSGGMPLVRHVDQYLGLVVDQLSLFDVSINFGELAESVVDDVLSEELGSVLIETVGHEYWDVVEPSVARSCREQYPLILTSNLEKRPCPRT